MVIVLFSLGITAQNTPQKKALSLQEIKELAYENNSTLKALQLVINQKEILAKATDFGKTEVFYNYEKDKIPLDNGVLNTYGIAQDFSLPNVYKAQKNSKKARIEIAKTKYAKEKQDLDARLEISYNEYVFSKEREIIYTYLDSVYRNFSHNANRKFELGATNYLEKITAKAKYRQIQMQYNQSLKEVAIAVLKIKQQVQTNDFSIVKISLEVLPISKLSVENNKTIAVFKAEENFLQNKIKPTKNELVPDFNVEYTYGNHSFNDGNVQSVQVGMKIPLFMQSFRAKVKASKIEKEIAQHKLANYLVQIQAKQAQLVLDSHKYKEAIDYYKTEGKKLSNAILQTATRSFKEGEIDFFQYIQSIENAYEIQLNYLENLRDYNRQVILLNTSN